MKIECKAQVKWDVTYRLSDGRLCKVEEDHPNHEKVFVRTTDGKRLQVYTGETTDGSLHIVESVD
ncbi:MAG: hypothetical protein ACYSW8_31560 [Planctomycetota bacterium]|jgi:hypothetical protein